MYKYRTKAVIASRIHRCAMTTSIMVTENRLSRWFMTGYGSGHDQFTTTLSLSWCECTQKALDDKYLLITNLKCAGNSLPLFLTSSVYTKSICSLKPPQTSWRFPREFISEVHSDSETMVHGHRSALGSDNRHALCISFDTRSGNKIRHHITTLTVCSTAYWWTEQPRHRQTPYSSTQYTPHKHWQMVPHSFSKSTGIEIKCGRKPHAAQLSKCSHRFGICIP